MLDMVENSDVETVMFEIGKRAQTATKALATAKPEAKNKALNAMADVLWDARADILEANDIDMVKAKENGTSSAFLDRLKLNEDRIKSMMYGLRSI